MFQEHIQVFHLFQTYVGNVSSGCFKSRSGVAHIAMAPVALQHHSLYKAFINASKNGQNALKDLLRHLLKRRLKHGSKRSFEAFFHNAF